MKTKHIVVATALTAFSLASTCLALAYIPTEPIALFFYNLGISILGFVMPAILSVVICQEARK